MTKKTKATSDGLLLDLLKQIQDDLDTTIQSLEDLLDGNDTKSAGRSKAEPEPEDYSDFDLPALSDEDIEDLAAAMDVKGKTIAAKRKALAALDIADVQEAFEGLDAPEDEADDKGADEANEDDVPDVVVADLTDEEVTEIATHLKLKKARSSVASLRKALEGLDQDALNEAFDAVYPEEDEKDEGEEVTLEMLQELSAKLLKAGERRAVRSILDQFKAKALGSAKEEDYPDLYDALKEAVDELGNS